MTLSDIYAKKIQENTNRVNSLKKAGMLQFTEASFFDPFSVKGWETPPSLTEVFSTNQSLSLGHSLGTISSFYDFYKKSLVSRGMIGELTTIQKENTKPALLFLTSLTYEVKVIKGVFDQKSVIQVCFVNSPKPAKIFVPVEVLEPIAFETSYTKATMRNYLESLKEKTNK